MLFVEPHPALQPHLTAYALAWLSATIPVQQWNEVLIKFLKCWQGKQRVMSQSFQTCVSDMRCFRFSKLGCVLGKLLLPWKLLPSWWRNRPGVSEAGHHRVGSSWMIRNFRCAVTCWNMQTQLSVLHSCLWLLNFALGGQSCDFIVRFKAFSCFAHSLFSAWWKMASEKLKSFAITLLILYDERFEKFLLSVYNTTGYAGQVRGWVPRYLYAHFQIPTKGFLVSVVSGADRDKWFPMFWSVSCLECKFVSSYRKYALLHNGFEVATWRWSSNNTFPGVA